MKATIIFVFTALFIYSTAFAVVRVVDKSGAGQYTTIQAAINASSTGDTIKVLPGIYDEPLIINKAVVIQGSGYETTIIRSSNNPTITMSAGKIMWFAITSSGGDGAQIMAGTITNCVVSGCTGSGIKFPASSTGSIKNSVIIGNATQGVQSRYDRTGSAVNCISRNNGGDGFSYVGGVTYCNGYVYNSDGTVTVKATAQSRY